MNSTEIQTLYEFDRWATLRTIESVAALTEDQRQEDLLTSFGGIHGALVHLLSADRVWLDRWRGMTPVPLKPEDVPSLESIKKFWDACFLEMGNFLRTLTDEMLAAPLEYSDFRGNRNSQPLVEQMLHKVNHATYHRGQIASMVRQQGGKPIGTDLITFYRQQEQNG